MKSGNDTAGNTARSIAEKFGGQSSLARLLKKRQSTVSHWVSTGIIPYKWYAPILEAAEQKGIILTYEDLLPATLTKLPARVKTKIFNQLCQKSRDLTAPLLARNLGITCQKEVDGVGMGVLTDGTAFLTGKGLARLVGVQHQTMYDIIAEHEADVLTPRAARIREILASHGGVPDHLCTSLRQRSGVFHAFPDAVCIAVLEYYAFDSPARPPEAVKNYRLLAGKALRDFIYTQVGYVPNGALPDVWTQFHDRLSLVYSRVPPGYFCVFKELSDVVLTLGQAGLTFNSSFVPDISAGILWGKHWVESNFDASYGDRLRFNHNYPKYFPQSVSNPQEAWCYPEMALGEFRRWLRENYIHGGAFKTYIESKVREKALPVSFSQVVVAAYGMG
jgi:hypothetical protein